MSVFTTVHEHQLTQFLTQFDCGRLVSFAGIAAGIENTNYFVTTDRYALVLTLFEHHQPDELHYFLDLMAYLAEHDIPTAHPMCSKSGSYLGELNGKPAALVRRLTGGSLEHPNAEECRTMGTALGQMHRTSPGFGGYRAPDRALSWLEETGAILAAHLAKDIEGETVALLEDELDFQQNHPRGHLPQGAIHADLFRDNALFEQGRLTGIIDLYYACNDALAYDLAVTINDWCRDEQDGIDETRARAMLAGYQGERPINDDERAAWPGLLRAAAMRFWLSRLKDQCFPREGEMTYQKDPEVFRRLLIAHRAQADATRAWLNG